MDKDQCPKCNGKSIETGYGFGFGALGAYTFCRKCRHLIELIPDNEGFSEEEAKRRDEKYRVSRD